jgi:undecaprenyl-diphosphatase
MSLEAALWIASGICFALFLALGHYLARTASLTRVDAKAVAIRGQATPLAAFLTSTGRGPFLTLAFALAAIGFWTFGQPVRIVAVVFCLQFLSQLFIEGFKRGWERHRPDYWLIGLERGFSYPSGHASTAITFFATSAVLSLLSPFPRPAKIVVASAFVLWAIGIGWSRLALGAHYPTDVAGGTLFGLAWVCAVAAISLHFHLLPFGRMTV